MMNVQDVLALALKMPAAYLDTPFGPEPICVRIGKRIFTEAYPSKNWVTFKCEPAQGLCWREQFPSSVRRGYYCPPVQQPYANTITMDGTVPDDLLGYMLEHSYQRALKALTKAERAAALAKA